MSNIDPMQANSAKKAKELGLKHYFTGIPCRRGHLSLRLASTAGCCECHKFKLKEWREKNAEHAREGDRAWRAKNIERINKQARERYIINREKMKAKTRRAYWGNREYYIQYARDYYERTKEKFAPSTRARAENYRMNFPEKAKAAIDRWWAKNPSLKKVYHRNRKARLRGNGGSHTAQDVAEIFKAQNGKCAHCRCLLREGHHVDHIVPLIKGGRNDKRNLQILCAPCNLKKAASDPIDFARSVGMLL